MFVFVMFVVCIVYLCVFFKQKTSYEMRISDWSSDVCSSDLNGRQRYMQVSITLLGRHQADLEALRVHMPLIRNNLVMLFSGQNFDTLATPVGQEMLRQQATASVQEVAQKELGKVVIEQLLFTNFVLQRSEEHTSELQSLMRISYAVFCLKKKKHQIYNSK